ncbi:MAG: hypothetical protein Q9199_006438, partial [Rusavskia elegans]
MLLLRFTKKRSLSTAGEKSPIKRCIKRGRFSSRLSSDEETETGDKSDSSTYTPSKPHPIAIPQPIPPHSTGIEEDTSGNSMIGFVGGRFRTAVIYEQQDWKGEIIQKKELNVLDIAILCKTITHCYRFLCRLSVSFSAAYGADTPTLVFTLLIWGWQHYYDHLQ